MMFCINVVTAIGIPYVDLIIYFYKTEFLEVGKKQPALDVLYDVIKSKKHRTWQKIHEPIMLKYLELCVDLRKSHLAKEGLYQYKNICQQVRVKIRSLNTKNVVHHHWGSVWVNELFIQKHPDLVSETYSWPMLTAQTITNVE